MAISDQTLSLLSHLPLASQWVKEQIDHLQPQHVVVCCGSEEEYQKMCDILVKKGSFIKLSEKLRPNSYLARSDPRDVARVEKQTFICSKTKEEAGPTNNWMEPEEMKKKLHTLTKGAMKGRTLYVIPYCMGPLASPFSKIGLELSDSEYVVANMKIMTRMGQAVIDQMKSKEIFVRGIHTVGSPLEPGQKDVAWPCNPNKHIVHFPEEQTIISYGSGYGGNALLGKKCFALRIASTLGHKESWFAEHMLIIGVTNPEGEKKFICAAFPSACGKTNMAMMEPTLPGWKVETVGDDIAWLRVGENGQLYAVNPENGFFGVAPGTSLDSNPNAIHSIKENSIFTNVALTDDGDVWWEGLTKDAPSHLIDWKGNHWTPASGTRAAHPNSRFTAPVSQCPTKDGLWEDPAGVPISAVLFGGRRQRNVPLVLESFNWNHGVYMGASISSAQTAAAEGTVGTLRHDPFAMLPFCGYNMGDYFNHWINMKENIPKPPAMYTVNWFRKSATGNFLWPGFGENIRVLKWIFERNSADLSIGAKRTPIGFVPIKEDMDLPKGFSNDNYEELFHVDPQAWTEELKEARRYFEQFSEHFPKQLELEMKSLECNLAAVL